MKIERLAQEIFDVRDEIPETELELWKTLDEAAERLSEIGQKVNPNAR